MYFLSCRYNMQIQAWTGQWEFFWILNMDSQWTQVRYADVHCGALSYIFHEYDPPSFPLKFKLSTLEFGTELPTYSSMNISLILVIIEVNLSFLFFIIGTYAFFNTRENFKLYLCFIFYTVIVAMVYMWYTWILWFLFSWTRNKIFWESII